jgi:hypothetical protein
MLDARMSAAPPLCFRLAPRNGAWHLTEESSGAIGGVFCSIAAAMTFVRAEARRSPGSSVLVELGPSVKGHAGAA